MRELLAKFYECPTCEDYSMELTLRGINHGKTARCIVFNYEDHHFVALYRPECKLIACDGEIIMNIPNKKMRKAA